MIIGKFKYNEKDDSYIGDVVTLNFTLEGVSFKPNTSKAGKEPDYRIFAPTDWGSVELGAAWKRTSERGKDFVSVELDAPLLAAPLNTALFLDDDGEHARLVWTRPRAKASAEVPSRTEKAA